jgi:hypothetical protein
MLRRERFRVNAPQSSRFGVPTRCAKFGREVPHARTLFAIVTGSVVPSTVPERRDTPPVLRELAQ